MKCNNKRILKGCDQNKKFVGEWLSYGMDKTTGDRRKYYIKHVIDIVNIRKTLLTLTRKTNINLI